MKRLFVTLLSLFLIFTLTSCVGGEDNPPDNNGGGATPVCTHEGGKASCVSAAVCAKCGESYGEIDPDAHAAAADWTTDSGKHYHVCENGCGVRLDESMCDIDVDCTSKGKCSVCGVEGTSLDPTRHSVSEEWTYDSGMHYHACENGCGTRFDEGVCDINDTCISPDKCSVCGRENDSAEPKKHNFSKEYTMEDDKHYRICLNGCGERADEAEHGFSEWRSVSASTTTSRGSIERSCTACSKRETMDSPAVIMSVKGGANGIVVLIHDDGTWATAVIADEMYKKYGLVGDVAMQLNGGRVVNSGDRYNLDDDTIQTNSILKWRTLFDTNRWKLISHSMTHKWWGTYDKTTNGDNTVCENLVSNTDLEVYEIVKSQALLRQYFPSQRVLTFAHPGFAEPKNYIPGVTTGLGKYQAVYNESARALMSEYYISARGGLGMLVDVNDPYTQWDTSDKSRDYAALSYSDVWNYFPAYGLDDSNMNSAITTINSAASDGGMAVFYIHQLSNLESEKDNSNTMYSGNYEQVLKAVSSHSASGAIWNAFYEDAVLYLREAQTARLDVRMTDDNTIFLTLTDDVSKFILDEDGNETDEQIYNYPLTVRINVPESWKAIRYEQDGKVGYAPAKLVDGRWVADAEIVPDGAEAKVTEASLSDIPEKEEQKPAVGSNTTLEYDVSYGFDNGTADIVTGSGAGAAIKTVGTNNWMHITKDKPSGNPYWSLYGSYLPAVAKSMSASFKIKIDKATLEAGTWGNITGNKRLLHITFSDSSPYALILYRDITSTTDGASGTLYLTDCMNTDYKVVLNDNKICALELDTEYEIRVELHMDGVNDFLAEIYVNGTKVKESSYAMNYTKGTVPTVEYVKFLAQGRAILDVLVDDVTLKTTAPEGEVKSTVYKQSFDNKKVSMSTGSNNSINAVYGSPADDGIVALNINKPKSIAKTHSWTMLGSQITGATSFSFKFDVYIDSESVTDSSTRLYQIHFASSTPYILTIELNSDKSGFVLKDMANTSSAKNLVTLSNDISFDEWHTIELVVTLDGDFSAMAYVDGATNGNVSENYGRANDGDAIRTTLDRVVLYAQKDSSANIYFDNLELCASANLS